MSHMRDTRYTPAARAAIETTNAARDIVDLARELVEGLTSPAAAEDRIRAARPIVSHAYRVLDLVVLAELLNGAAWEDVARALDLPEAEARRRYQPTVERWLERADGAAETAPAPLLRLVQ